MRPKKLAFVLLAAVVGVALMAGTALAQTAGSSNPAQEKLSSALEKLVERGVITQDQAKAVLDEAAPLFQDLGGGRVFRAVGLPNIIDSVAKALGMEPKDLLAQLREGKSLAAIIEAKGSTVEAVVATLTAEVKTKVDQAVADGKITAAQGERIVANFQRTATTLIQNANLGKALLPGLRGLKGPMLPKMGVPDIFSAVARQLSMESKDLLAQLREGKSVAAIIEAQGSSVDAVAAALTAEYKSKVDQAVADGKITAAQGERMVANYQQHVKKVLENPGLHKGLGRGRGPGHRAGPQGGMGMGGMNMSGMDRANMGKGSRSGPVLGTRQPLRGQAIQAAAEV